MMLHALCLPVYVISLLGLLPATSWLRGPIFERALDVSLPIFLLALTVSSGYSRGHKKNGMLMLCLFVAVLIALTSIASIINFGIYYFLVEYRQYVLISFSVIFLRALRRKFSLKKISKFSKIYIFMMFIVFFLNSLFGVQYRPGVFGESNYDLSALALVLIAFLRMRRAKYAMTVMLAFTTLSLSRTAMATFSIYVATQVRSFLNFFLFGFFSLVIIALLVLRSELPLLEIEINTIDRFVMAKAYFDEVYSNPVFMIFGQPLTNSRFQLDALSYYSDRQPVSAMLGITTPSNFHGHILRGLSLIGVVGYLLFLGLLAIKIIKNFTKLESGLIFILVVVTGFTQSIFSHPLVGAILFAFLWVGFDDRKENVRAREAFKNSRNSFK